MPTKEKPKVTQSEAAEWYDGHAKLYEKYAMCVHNLLESLLKEEGLPYQSITCRVKERSSYLEKCRRKSYGSFEEITDVAGLRIIAYTIGDVERICTLIEQELEIDRENSVDKAAQLNSDQMGYLSRHYIASFTPERAKLREYRAYKGMKCEIQVRTLLQHTWAEFEHDRNYKFSGVLPKNVERKFYPLAGLLELADQEFQRLSDQLDEYGREVAEETSKGNLDFPIDSTSLFEFMQQRFPWTESQTDLGIAIEELNSMGIETLGKLESLISEEFIESEKKRNHNTYIGVLRDIMICNNVSQYFLTAWNKHWMLIVPEALSFYEAHGIDIRHYMKQYHIEIEK